MNGFEKIKKQIDSFSCSTDARKEELKSRIEPLKDKIQKIKEAEESSIAENNMSDFQKYQVELMFLVKQLENSQDEFSLIENSAPMTAAEHKEIKTELKNLAKNNVLSDYKRLIDLLDEGASIIAEIKTTINEYHAIMAKLNHKVEHFEVDKNGIPFETFVFSDCYKIPGILEDVFCKETMGSIRCILNHKIQIKSVN